MTYLNGLNVEKSDIEAHNGISIVERYHVTISSIFRNILTMPRDRIGSKLNYTMGPDGLLPSLIMLREMKRTCIPAEFGQRLTVEDNVNNEIINETEMLLHVDKIRVKICITQNFPRTFV